MTLTSSEGVAANNEAIFDLIGGIYDAALEPDLWPNALSAITKHFRAVHSAIVDENYAIMTAQQYIGSMNLDVSQLEKYNNSHIFINPLRVPTLLTKTVGDIFTATEILGKEEFEATRFYQNYVVPNGWGEALIAMISKTKEKIDLFIITRHVTTPAFSESERVQVRLLVPHVQKAFHISLAMRQAKKEVADLRAAVDEVSSAIFFLDSNAHVAHMNAAARSLILRKDLLGIELDQLKALNVGNQKKFESVLTSSLFDQKHEFLMTGSSGDDYVFRVLPLPLKVTSATADGRASTMVFVKRAEMVPSSSIELIADRYSLTPREMNVLVAIVEAGDVPDAASILGLQQSTVRSHLKSVFQKTGLGSQLDLAKLVASFV